MLDSILSLVNQPEYLEDLLFQFSSVVWVDSLMKLTVAIKNVDSDGSEYWSRWEISCENVWDARIRNHWGEYISLHGAEHPAVREHTDSRREVYFRGRPGDVNHLIGSLWRKHVEIVGDWIPFRKYFNAHCALDYLLGSGSGQLANGPSFLMEAYFGILEENDIAANLLPVRPPKVWDMNQNLVQPSAPLYLLELGESYVVAECFKELRIVNDTE